MSRLFNPRATVAIGNASFGEAVLIEDLRISFRAEKSLDRAPNKLKLSVHNLSERQRARVQAKDTDLVLQAGYEDNIEVLYSGQIRTADHKYEGADWVSTIECGDGEVAVATAHVSESFGENAPLMSVATKVAESMGLGLGNLQEKLEAPPGGADTISSFSGGYSAFGHAAKELEKLLKPMGLSFSIQEGQLLVLGENEVHSGIASVLLTPDTGLVGSPELGTPDKVSGRSVMKCKALLQPAIRPGGLLVVESANLRGRFRVNKVVHNGDTQGQAWHTEIEASEQ